MDIVKSMTDMCDGGAYIKNDIESPLWVNIIQAMDIVKSMTDMCDGGAHIKRVIVV